MNVQENLDQSMALQGVVWRESAKRVEDLGFYFKYIMEAILRIVAVSGHNEITDSSIIDQIDLIKGERNLSVDEIKRPNADTKKNITRDLEDFKEERNLSEEEIKRPNADTKKNKTRDLEELRRENHKMINMMFCKSCNISIATCVNMNENCRHLLCSKCSDVLTFCKKCREMITETSPVKFAKNKVTLNLQ